MKCPLNGNQAIKPATEAQSQPIPATALENPESQPIPAHEVEVGHEVVHNLNLSLFSENPAHEVQVGHEAKSCQLEKKGQVMYLLPLLPKNKRLLG
nr:uncharacterized protein LOC109156168 [Ipomoea batatas]